MSLFGKEKFSVEFIKKEDGSYNANLPSDIAKAIGKSVVAMPYVIFDEFTEQRQKGLILFSENTWKAVEDTVTPCYSRPIGSNSKSLHFIENMRTQVFLEDNALLLPKKLVSHAEIKARGVIWQDGLEFWLVSR